MAHVYDVAIVGAGAMGSATARTLTGTGRDVVVLEQHQLGHDRGGSHGATRIFRVGTEQAHILDMAERARVMWAELSEQTGTEMLTFNGAIEHGMGAESAREFGAMLTAKGVDHEIVEEEPASERWPGLRFDGPVLYQPGGAIIHADRAIAGLQQLATAQGAEFRTGTRVEQISLDDPAAAVVLQTTGGPVLAHHVVVTVGSWADKLLGGVVTLPRIWVTQEQPRLFAPYDDASDWPCFVHWRDEGGDFGHFEAYGLYEEGAGYKVGLHAGGPTIDPDARDFLPEPVRDEVLRAYVQSWFPGLDPDRSIEISCLYDNTDNGDFVIDRVGPVTFATGFNGEGFKFVPLIGRMLSDIAQGTTDPPPIFSVARHVAARPN